MLGTGDLSEIALGWSTYGVGDQMSHYNVNASVSKTLIQHLVRWVIKSELFDQERGKTLGSILDTVISPELVPADAQGQIQSNEDKIGPYDLHDFFLYYVTRFGLKPSKVAYLAHNAWHSRETGEWPMHFPANEEHEEFSERRARYETSRRAACKFGIGAAQNVAKGEDQRISYSLMIQLI